MKEEPPLNLTAKGGPLRKTFYSPNLTDIGARIIGQHPLLYCQCQNFLNIFELNTHTVLECPNSMANVRCQLKNPWIVWGLL